MILQIMKLNMNHFSFQQRKLLSSWFTAQKTNCGCDLRQPASAVCRATPTPPGLEVPLAGRLQILKTCVPMAPYEPLIKKKLHQLVCITHSVNLLLHVNMHTKGGKSQTEETEDVETCNSSKQMPNAVLQDG